MVLEKQQIMALIQGRRLGEAKTECVKLCRSNHEDAEAWFMLAGIHAQTGNMAEVAACCSRVVEIQPGNVQAHYNLGVALQMQNREREAADSYRRVLAIQPDYAVAHANLALALRYMGLPEEALASCRQALQFQPEMAEARNTAGLIMLDQSRFEDAEAEFRQAIQLRPNYAEAIYNLGICQVRQSRLEAAGENFRAAIKARPNYADAYCDLGKLLHQRGDLDDAAAQFRQALRSDPRHIEACMCLGAVLGQQEKIDEAAVQYRRAVELKADSAEAWNNLGMMLMLQDGSNDNFAEIEGCFRQALRLKPDAAPAHLHLGTLYSDMGNFEAALASYRSALEIQPDISDAAAGMALTLERKGDFEAGYAALKPWVEEEREDHISVALSFAALARHIDRRSEAAAMLERCLCGPIAPRIEMEAHFALGKLYDEMQDYARAFEQFRLANSMDRSKFVEAENRRKFDDLIATFTPEAIALRPRASNRSKLPIFIVGMPRSGTSLVEQILASHPLVHGAGELSDIRNIVTSIPGLFGDGQPYPQCLNKLTRKMADSIAQRHLDKLSGFSRQAARVTDKMPHNFLSLGLIDVLFPGARVIHVKRHPMDNCLSIYTQPFNAAHAYANDLKGLGQYYRQYQRLMAHWKQVLRIPILEVQYEELVADQERITRDMLDFCELGWDERCLRFHESRRVVTTLSYDQVRRPMYKKSIERWRAYEPYLDPLLSEFAEVQPD